MALMNQFMKGLFGRAGLWLLRHYRLLSIDLLKIKGAIWYIRGVRTARKAYIGVVLFFLCLALVTAGFILLHVGLFALLPAPANAITLLVLGAIYLIVGLSALAATCSEKRWMKLSRADRMVARATKQHDE